MLDKSPLPQELAVAVEQECEDLHDLIVGLPDDAWSRQTKFYGWTVKEEVLHLHFLDLLGIISIEEPDQFIEILGEYRRLEERDDKLRYFTVQRLGDMDIQSLKKQWRTTFLQLCDLFARTDLRTRMKWFGPDMSVATFASSRQMETWAHGQDIWDLLGRRRVNTDRLWNIASLGVRTFGWSFVNRGLPPPTEPPLVRLNAPSGVQWVWNKQSVESQIAGSAEEFCLVVTKRKNAGETTLSISGKAATSWLEIAQCFAGPPLEAPKSVASVRRAAHFGRDKFL